MDQHDFAGILARLRSQGRDDGSTEVKASQGSLSKDVWDSVSAFANTEGGLVALGLSEHAGFTPVAGFDIDRVVDQFVDGIGDGKTLGARLTNPPTYRLHRFAIEDHPVLAIEIDENLPANKPCFVTAKGMSGGAYKRVDDKDIRLSATEIFQMQNLLVDHGADRQIVPEATVDDLDERLVDEFVASRRSSKALRGASERSTRLTRLNITDGDSRVRLAGLLTLGRYPQQYLPRLLVDVSVHPAAEKSPANTQLRFFDRVECDGPLPELVSDAVNAVAKNLRTHSVIDGATRRDELEIPRAVLREAIANAVLHREYHPMFRGQPVTVDVYPDRVVVTNPGGLWGGKTVENIDDGVSRCRNQTLLQILQHAPEPSGEGAVAEGQGSGVRSMINTMAARGLDRPHFRATPDQVSVELRRHGVEVPEVLRWAREAAHGADLSRPEETALIIAKRDGHVSVATLREALGMDSDLVRPVLRHLAERSILALVGPEDYTLGQGEPATPSSDIRVLNVLSMTEPLDIHDLAQMTGRSATALRPVLRRLVSDGRVIATAPPTSRQRKYLLQRSR